MSPVRPKLILASQSPRRRELLAAAGYSFEVHVPSPTAECGICSGEGAARMVARRASQKARDVGSRIDSGLIVACDTVAECGGEILGKPHDEDHARHMLQLLRGRRHRVVSGLCLWDKPRREPVVEVETTTLQMDLLSDREIAAYLATGQWEGKAGAFGYQDRVGMVHVLAGSESNVVGLPMELLARLIAELGE
jgi:septum formation protein